MKAWVIDYSIKTKNGEVREETAHLEAENIIVAMGRAYNNIAAPMKKFPDVEDVTIWNIGIVAPVDDPEAVF